MTIDTIFSRLAYAADHPRQTALDYMERSGKKAIGCTPIYTPAELVHAAGMHPVGLWGGSPELIHAKRFFPPFMCSIMQAILEYGMDGTYDFLSGIITSAPCDALKNTGQSLRFSTSLKIIGISHPLYRKEDFGIRFLKSEYVKAAAALEEIAGQTISDACLFESIELFNSHRRAMREFDQTAALHTAVVTPSRRHSVMRSALYMDKKEHLELVTELTEQLKKMPPAAADGNKVILTGIQYDGKDLLEILEHNRISVVGDDLSQETRQYAVDCPLDRPDPIQCLARQWSHMCPDSVVFDFDRNARGRRLVELARERGADGIIFAGTKFCEPEEYDYVMVKKFLEANGMPLLHIEVDQQTRENQAIHTRIQAFTEMLP
jgi:bcr-type benzoyl-CoA reductase subunit C